jgi:hypothetical protein
MGSEESDVKILDDKVPPTAPIQMQTPKGQKTPRKVPTTPGKSQTEAPRFFHVPEKKADVERTTTVKGRKKKIAHMDPSFNENEVGW